MRVGGKHDSRDDEATRSELPMILRMQRCDRQGKGGWLSLRSVSQPVSI